MLITPEKIEMWKQDPKLYDYDRGYHNGSMDAWNEPEPMIFTKIRCTFRLNFLRFLLVYLLLIFYNSSVDFH